uniref:Uncharacterized protein n=1 Tax=Anguilla anguilla TaxID=7936 RepID=A0A0E9WMU0_ANGAN
MKNYLCPRSSSLRKHTFGKKRKIWHYINALLMREADLLFTQRKEKEVVSYVQWKKTHLLSRNIFLFLRECSAILCGRNDYLLVSRSGLE